MCHPKKILAALGLLACLLACVQRASAQYYTWGADAPMKWSEGLLAPANSPFCRCSEATMVNHNDERKITCKEEISSS